MNQICDNCKENCAEVNQVVTEESGYDFWVCEKCMVECVAEYLEDEKYREDYK